MVDRGHCRTAFSQVEGLVGLGAPVQGGAGTELRHVIGYVEVGRQVAGTTPRLQN